MTQCLCENVSLIFCFLKCCADMPQRPPQPEPPQDRSDKFRAGRLAPTGSARREKQALNHPMAGRGRGGGTRPARVDAAGGSLFQMGLSQMVDPTQYQQDYQVYQQAQDQAYHLRSLSLTSISLMRISNISMKIIMSSLILRSRSSRMILSSLSSMMVGVMLKGCRGWCTMSDRTAMQGAFWPHAFTSFW